MKKKVLSLFMSFAICFTVMLDTAYAAAPEDVTVSGNASAENGSTVVQNAQTAAVQALIDALPSLEELQTADAQKQQEIYEALQEAYDAYEALSAEEQALLTGADCFESLFGWFNAQVSLLEEDEHWHCRCGKHYGGHDCTFGLPRVEWQPIIDANNNNKIDTDELPTISGNVDEYFYLTADAELSSTYEIPEGKTLYLCLNGHSLTGTMNGAVIQVKGTLYLTDCNGSGSGNGKVTHGSQKTGSGISCENTGTFCMYGGSISGNTADNGGGVFCVGNFYMYGGSINDNSATNGGGFYLGNADNKTVQLKGGSISNNNATNGGGIYTVAFFEISGTRISSNTATGNGGGICQGETTIGFSLTSGEISGNKATNGGGVYVTGPGSLQATGGSITDNTATEKGGGVALSAPCTLGGSIKITANTAGSGTPATDSNLYLMSSFVNGDIGYVYVQSGFCGDVSLTVDDDLKLTITEGTAPIVNYNGSAPSGTIRLDGGGSIDETGKLVNHNHTWSTGGTCGVTNCGEKLVASVNPSGGTAVYYTALSAALTAAGTGETVTVLQDTTLPDNYKITKGITLELNGKTVTMGGTLSVLAENVVITDSSTSKGGRIEDTEENKVCVTVKKDSVKGGLSIQGGTLGNIDVYGDTTFALTGGKIDNLTLFLGTVELSGGKLGSISIWDGSSKVKDLLQTGYVIKKTVGTTSSYLSVSEQESNQLVALTGNGYYEAVESPLESVTVTAAPTEVTYGAAASDCPIITVTATKPASHTNTNVTYQWYLDGEIDSGQTKETYTFSSDHSVKLENGTVKPYTVKCVVNCDGYTVEVEKEITVKQADLSAASVSVTGSPFTYKASNHTLTNADVKVTYNGKTLTGGTDYVIDDTSDISAADARTYTVKIKAVAGTNYTGGQSAQWTIAPKPVTASAKNITVTGTPFTYTGSPIKPIITIQDGTTQIPSSEYTVAYSNNTAVGTATITITDKKGGNYEVSGSRTFTIGKAQNTATVSMANYTYGDTPSTPTVTGKLGDGAVTCYYSTENSNRNGRKWENMTATSLNAGTYYLYAEIAEDANYQACKTAAVEFTVLQATPAVTTWPTVREVYVGDTLTDNYLDLGSAGTGAGTGAAASVPGTFSITGTKCWDTSGSKTTELTFTPTDRVNYQTVTKQNVGVEVVLRTADTPVFTDKTVTYNGSAQSHVLAAEAIPTGVASVKYEYEGTNGTSYPKSETAPINAGSYTVTASFTMTDGYEQLPDATAVLTIARKDIAAADIVLGATLTANGETQTQTIASVKLGELTLTAEDYELSGNTAGEAGEYTLTIRGKGNYSGEATKNWHIAEAEQAGAEGEGSAEGGSSEESTEADYENYSWLDVDALLRSLINSELSGTAYEGGNVNVRIPGENVIPAYVLNTLCGTDLTLALQQGGGVALSISGSGIGRNALDGLQTIDLTTDINANAIPETLIREKHSGVNRQLTIRDTGRFAVPVNLHINMGSANAGRYANFYRYNAVLGRLEYCGSFRITENGQAMTALRQGGSYLVNVTDTRPVETGLFTGASYTVKSGDTLSRIAAAYDMSLSELLRRNPWIADANKIRVGQRINVN